MNIFDWFVSLCQGKDDLNKNLEKLEKELANTKKSTGETVNQIKAEKVKAEKEAKEATMKIIKLQDENAKLKSKLNEEVSDLNR